MKVKRLCGENFRNLMPFDVEFCDDTNIIYGNNAQGKTNLIEAIWLFTGAKSFRGAKDNEMVAFSGETANLKMDFVTGGVERQAKIKIGSRRTAELDGKKLKSAAGLVGNFCATVFSPLDLGIVKEGPSMRRRFLDLAIGQLYPNYVAVLKDYSRVVFQRNYILKQMDKVLKENDLLNVFEAEIVELGEKIAKYRLEYCKNLTLNSASIYNEISSLREELEAVYMPSIGEDFAEQLYSARKTDVFSGITSVGPHRDDLDFKINGISARTFGSQGQQRSIAIALKLAEAKNLMEITGEEPVVIFDDVMSELDKSRQSFILNHIKGKQVFITCPDPDNITGLVGGKVFTVDGGKIK